MGQTYNIVCDQCRVSLWVAQDIAYHRESFYIYGGNHAFPKDNLEQYYSPLAEFLLTHERHPLRFVGGEDEQSENYLELDTEPGLPVSDDQSPCLEPDEIEKAKEHLAAQLAKDNDPDDT